ncbi:hypothetical protein DL769_011398 [Monosporascus sp. CRB-8-3]|nr:hypothetical protein DL769_011398 [Monosporascus sp. CRB-8-3]
MGVRYQQILKGNPVASALPGYRQPKSVIVVVQPIKPLQHRIRFPDAPGIAPCDYEEVVDEKHSLDLFQADLRTPNLWKFLNCDSPKICFTRHPTGPSFKYWLDTAGNRPARIRRARPVSGTSANVCS